MPSKPPTHRPTPRQRPPDDRPSPSARGYDHAWEGFRERVLADAEGVEFPEGGPVCRDCLEQGIITPAEHVDHKTTLRSAPELKFDPHNVRSLCHCCHSKKTAKYDRARN